MRKNWSKNINIVHKIGCLCTVLFGIKLWLSHTPFFELSLLCICHFILVLFFASGYDKKRKRSGQTAARLITILWLSLGAIFYFPEQFLFERIPVYLIYFFSSPFILLLSFWLDQVYPD